jgi:hypothetical protein
MLLAAAAVAGGVTAAVWGGAKAQALWHAGGEIWVFDQLAPENAQLGDWLEQRRRRLGERQAYLSLPDLWIPARFSELGLELDVSRTMRDVLAARERATPWRLVSGLLERREPIGVEPSWRWHAERARSFLEHRVATLVHAPPAPERFDVDRHRRIEEQSGRELDVEATLRAIAAASREDSAPITVVCRSTQAPASVGAVDITKVLASYETDFARRAGRRAVNIRVAAKYLDGTVMAPGQTISFNRVVGPRRSDRGFVKAPVLVNDETEPGLGGGVCQLATTLHAAAVYGALEVIQRRSHSRPSGYAPLGLDAAVIEDKVDLKLKNPYDTPLLVHAFLPMRTTVRVELLGREPPGRVEHLAWVREKHDFYRRVSIRSELGPGDVKQQQKGIFGYDVQSLVRITYPDGTRRSRSYKSTYYPVPEVFWVGSEADTQELPELPKGATHVEVKRPEDAVAPAP